MCGRYTLVATPDQILKRFRAQSDLPLDIRPRYNIPPATDVPTITVRKQERYLETMKWGIYRQWDKEKAPLVITNLTVEKLSRGTFKTPLSKRRCIIPADGFYEWQTLPGKKVPYRFTMIDGELFSFAAIYDEPSEEYGPATRTFTLFTTTPNSIVESVHDRMPCILPKEWERTWLDPDLDAERAISLLKPYPAERMKRYEVSRAVNSSKNDTPDLITPVAA